MAFEKIKVLETIRQGKIGGGETHVLDLVAALDKEIFEPIVLSFTNGPMIDRLNSMGIKSHVIPTERPFDVTKWNKVKRFLANEQIDLLHAHGTRANSNTFWAAKKLGIPVIYTVHGWSFHADQHPLVKRFRVAGERLLINNSDTTVCVSENNLNEGKALFDMERSMVIKNGINFNKFDYAVKFKNVRQELGINRDEILVGYIARITAQKDPFTLLRAIAKIPDTIKIKFLVVGDGDLKKATIKLARDLDILQRVIFLDFRQDVPDILNAIDIYCLPSLWEGLPIGLLEAMAMKKAVIATSIDGTKEVIEHMVNGLMIPVMNPERLANSILSLAFNSDLRNSLSINALNTIRKNYNIQAMTKEIETLYKKTLASKEGIADVIRKAA